MTKMLIIPAAISDIDELASVEVESKKQSNPEIIEPFEIDLELRKKRWITYFNGESPASSKPERIVYKAVNGNRITGYIAGHLTSRYDMDAEIQSFYVLYEYQRKGTGSQLLLSMLGWLKEHNAKSLCVGISPDNKYKAFYLKYGGKYLNPHWIYWDDINLPVKKIQELPL